LIDEAASWFLHNVKTGYESRKELTPPCCE